MFHSLSSLGWLRLSNEQFYSHFNKGGGRETVIKLSPFGSAAPVTHTNGEFWCQAGRHAQSTGSAAFPWGHAVSENTSRGQTVPELSSALLLLSLPSWGGSRCWGCEGDESLLQTCTHTSSCLGKSFVQRCFWPVLPISQLFYIIYNISSLRVLLWGAFLSGSCGQAEKCCSVFQALVFHSHSLSCRQPALESTSFLAGSGSWLCFSGYTNQWTWRCLAGALTEPTPSTDSHWDALSADLRRAPCTSLDTVCCLLSVHATRRASTATAPAREFSHFQPPNLMLPWLVWACSAKCPEIVSQINLSDLFWNRYLKIPCVIFLLFSLLPVFWALKTVLY